ncbi:MAG: 50S ribosomal protein L5 [Nitrososphaerota archaeon]|jgi:large subunit ribosomal protein L5|nr:50S ribosomal protein L5 [Nitrososphaerota archaeon]MDG6955815.1 50S ribosomal protein L5 [Nitrososphaerota archaeon]MDG6957597.1 50S ribosomal protein L5 [Nitrososphaerota archaeon]MDG6959113.1 50S ribosomal protein L5 [Nitrososphaerota archaeon]MDG6965207.1 50S ribosomal protein L5 [Nitrososphaerota archaeon]
MSQSVVQAHPMRGIKVGKVVVNIGLGKSGEAIERGKKVLEQVTGQAPTQTRARDSVRDFGIHKGEPIGVVVTVRGEETKPLITKLLAAREKKLQGSSFDPRGSVSFGIKEHIEIPGIRYDPAIGILGMNVSVLLERPGYSVSRRNRRTSRVGKGQRVSREEAMQYFKDNFGANIQ